MGKVTLKKIGDQLGISAGTVSKALKDYDDISLETKRKVRELADQLQFKPNSFAQSLRNKESKIIGLIVPELVHHFFSSIVLGIIKSAEELGYAVITLQSDESFEIEKKQIELLLERDVDGLILSLADDTVSYKHLAELIDEGLPVVLVDKISRSVECSKVVIDDRKAAFRATQYLIDSGCKTIAHIRGPLKPQTTIDRFNGYKDALRHNNLSFNKSLVFEAPNLMNFEDGKQIAKQISENRMGIDGIFAFTDLSAVGVMTELVEQNIKVPEEISIVGFSNWLLTQLTTPPLSTINQPGKEMGKIAFNLLYDELKNRKKKAPVTFKTVEVPAELIVRGSTK